MSGGWLGKLVISIANTFGIFDVLVLAVVGVVWYLTVRMSMSEPAILLGLYLDGVIPLQYYRTSNLAELMQKMKRHTLRTKTI